MATKIKILAGRIMDLYYEDYASNTQFFDIDDFIFNVGSTYADLLSKEYDTERQRMRIEGEEGYATFSHDWLQTQVCPLKRKGEEGDYYQLIQKPMSFPYDKYDIGIQNVFPVGSKFRDELVRDSIDKSWQDKFLPNTKNVFWSLIQDTIIVRGSVNQSPPPSIRVVYVPEVSLDLEIPNSRNAMITAAVLVLMRKLEENHLVKETNDQNKNKLPITENDKNLIKQ